MSVKSKLGSPQDKLYVEYWKEVDRQIEFEKKITNRYILHKGHLCKVHLRSDDKLLYGNCEDCKQFIGLKKFETYVIENEETVVPYYRHDHIIRHWFARWDLFDDLQPFRKHECRKRKQ